MKIASLAPSFGSVIPIKRIVVGDEDVLSNQLRINTDSSEAFDEIPSSCTENTTDKILLSLCRILSKNDGKTPLPQTEALNNMLRRSVAYVDKSYKLPAKMMTSDQSSKPKHCSYNGMNYILTGPEASEYAINGKRIGESRVLVRDFEESSSVIKESKKRFGLYKMRLIEDKSRRLQDKFNSKIGMVVYVDTPKHVGKSRSDSFTIKSVDFEWMET